MADLRDILYQVNLVAVSGKTDIEAKGICFDSRKIKAGDIFVAVRGTQHDGHNFLAQAAAMGAAAIICETLPPITEPNVVYITVQDSAQALGVITSNFFDNPSKKLKLVGVTGTNGKTTVVTLLHQLYSALGYKAGMLSTVVNKIAEEEIPSTHTTPDPIQLNQLLASMVKQGCTHCFMEVSSHAVVQGRIAGLHFAGALFTNLTHDHLDYHGTFDRYIRAKKGFFDALPSNAFALVNIDDKRGQVMLQNCKAKKTTMSLAAMADFRAKIISNTIEGLELDVNGKMVWFTMVGSFNAYNIITVFGAAMLLGEEEERVLTCMSTLKGAPGRMEMLRGKFIGIVDYAHTPDALKNVLETINNFRTGNEQVIAVVGCGGDRDRSKRPLMADIACKNSDKVILTSDNPRHEETMEIIRDMQTGVRLADRRKTLVMPDREEAIKTACLMAQEKDIVLVAGKGHEAYQDIKGVKHPFDDREVLGRMLHMFKK